MITTKVISSSVKNVNGSRHLFSVPWRNLNSIGNEECTKSVVYPSITSTSKKAKREQEKQLTHEKYKALNTIEEKLFAVNLPKYYGWKSLILREGVFPYNFLEFVQHITRTQLLKTDESAFYSVQEFNVEECKELGNKIRQQLQEAIIFEVKGRKSLSTKENVSDSEHGDNISRAVVKQINGIILANLSSAYPHLLESVIDYDPRLEAFWSVGGFHPSEELYKERKDNKDLTKEEKAEPVEHWIQYFGKPFIQLRSTLPLPVFNTDTFNHISKSEGSIPNVRYDPALAYGLQFERRHGTNIPGFWPGDENEFGLLSFHGRGYLLDRPPHFGIEEHEASLDAQAILAAYAWVHAQACYQGFSTFHELTYPLVTQNIITDGRLFSFYLYQLNTTLLHGEHINNNPRVNFCLKLPSAPLYHHIQGTEIIGWNDIVLTNLISRYLQIPQKRDGVPLKPYVHKTEHYLAEIEEGERRTWLHNQFRHMYSNRPRNRLPYEIFDWERIYKIKFETRPGDARFRPFELDANPTEERKYFEHMPPYIPRKLRPRRKHWTGWRAKFEKTHYPEL